MKRIIITLLLFAAIKVAGQTTGYLRFDTVRIMKQNGTCELYIINKTKDSLGFLYNVGGGLTQFRRIRQITDTSFVAGTDTIRIVGTGGGGSGTVTNVATGYGLSGGPITITGTLLVDSATLSSYYLRRKDSVLYVTQTKLNDTAAAIRSAIGGSANSLTKTSSDVYRLSQIKTFVPARGITSSTNTANYTASSIDSVRYYFSTTRAGSAGTEFGGWLASSTSGDSAQVTVPFGVLVGNSITEGHPGRHGRLHPLVAGVATATFVPAYPDSTGQLSYHLRALTKMRWYNHGIGGQTAYQVRQRFYRDVVGVISTGMGDSRGTQTLSRKPYIAIIECGINDLANGASIQSIKDNLEWMASVCQAEGIRCVMLNMPGDSLTTQTFLRGIAEINEWLRSGVMDQYGASVVDFNSWWNNPAYGNDNIHRSPYITDDIHPSMVGYDSLANYIFRSAKLPVLTKVAFTNQISPDGFTGYSRPHNITINGDAYAIDAAFDTLDITTYVPDSVWIKVISSDNITGTSTSGFSHIEWYLDNNVANDSLYTRKTLYSGSVKNQQNISNLRLEAKINGANGSPFPVVDVRLQDTTLRAFQVGVEPAGARVVVNGGTVTANLNNAVLSVYGIISNNSNIISSGTASQFSNLQLQGGARATGTGYGIGHNISGVAGMAFDVNNNIGGRDMFRFDFFSGGLTQAMGATTSNVLNVLGGFGNATGSNQLANAINITPVYNQTTSNPGLEIRGINYNPTLTSLTSTKHFFIRQISGNNYFNATSDSTCFGCTTSADILTKFRVNGTVRLDGMLAGTGTSPVLVKDADSVVRQVAQSSLSGVPNFYNVNGTFGGDRTVTGSNNDLHFSGIDEFKISSNTFVFQKNAGTFPYTGSIAGGGNSLALAYTPVAGTYSKGEALVIDTNNNVGIGAQMPSTAPGYAAGINLYSNSNFLTGAAVYNNATNVTATGSVGLNQHRIYIDATGGAVTLTLPAASSAFGNNVGIVYIFQRIDNSGNTITIQRAGSDTINGATSFTLTTQWEMKEVHCRSSSAWAQY